MYVYVCVHVCIHVHIQIQTYQPLAMQTEMKRVCLPPLSHQALCSVMSFSL